METNLFDIGYATSRRDRIETSIEESKHKFRKREHNISVLAALFIENPSDKNFNDLVKRIKWGLKTYIKRIVKTDEAVDEVMSRTLENIYFNRNMFNPDIANFSTWMYRIAYINSVKYLKGEYGYNYKDKYVDTPLELDGSEDKFIDYCDNVSDFGDVSYNDFDIVYENGKYHTYSFDSVLCDTYDASVKCISCLPDKYRLIMSDRYLKSMKVEDIAIQYRMSVARVKNYIREARARIEDDVKCKYPTLHNLYLMFYNDNE